MRTTHIIKDLSLLHELVVGDRLMYSIIADNRDCLLGEAKVVKTANPTRTNINATDRTTELASGHVDSIAHEFNNTSALHDSSSTTCTDGHDDNVPSETSTVDDPDMNVVAGIISAILTAIGL